MSTTPNLALTYMTEGSAQKEVIHNTNMDILDSSFVGFSTGHTKALTNTAVNLFEVALASGARAGGILFATITVTDGTNHQALTDHAQWSCINKAGVYTTHILVSPSSAALAVSAGTLTAAWSVLTGTNKITIRVTPATSLTFTTYSIHYTIINHSAQAITFV